MGKILAVCISEKRNAEKRGGRSAPDREFRAGGRCPRRNLAPPGKSALSAEKIEEFRKKVPVEYGAG